VRNRGIQLKFAGLVSALALVFARGNAFAQPVDESARSAARNLGYEGVAAFQAKDYPTALTKLEKAYRVLQAPSLGLWSGRALRESGKWVEAAERFREVSRLSVSSGDTALQEKSKKEAAAELSELAPRIPSIVLAIEGASSDDVGVTLDKVKVAPALIGERLPTNPGTHRIEAVRGAEHVSAEVTIAASESKPVTLRFKSGGAAPTAEAPAARPAAEGSTTPETAAPVPAADQEGSSNPLRTVGWVAIGVGGAGLVVGTVTSILLFNKQSELESNPSCANNACTADQRDAVESYNGLRPITSAAFIAGGVLAAGGLALVLFTPSSSGGDVKVSIGPGSARVSGSF
jgi:hypothetical protein